MAKTVPNASPESRSSAAIARATSIFDDIEASKTTSETLAATKAVMALLDKLGERAQSAAGSQYAKLLKSGRWWLAGWDMKWEARQQRKLYDEAGAHLFAAADALSAVIARQEQLLAAANRKDSSTYKPGE